MRNLGVAMAERRQRTGVLWYWHGHFNAVENGAVARGEMNKLPGFDFFAFEWVMADYWAPGGGLKAKFSFHGGEFPPDPLAAEAKAGAEADVASTEWSRKVAKAQAKARPEAKVAFTEW